MNSFTVTAVGNLAKDPELAVKGDTTYTRLCLVGNDYAGKDERGNVREAVTTVWFVAFESLGEAIANMRAREISLFFRRKFGRTIGPIRRARSSTTIRSSFKIFDSARQER
jgi:hypothetical protein